MLGGVRRRHVDHMEQEGRFGDLFQSRSKSFDEGGRQVANEADRVAEQDSAIGRQNELTDGRIQCGEHLGVGQNISMGKPVEQRRFTRVGVTDQPDGSQRYSEALLSLNSPACADSIEMAFQSADPAIDAAAIGFKLRFAGPSGSDTATEPRHGNAFAGQSRKQVIELSELHLQLAFPGAGSQSEDVQDQLGTIDHFRGKRPIQISLLRRSQVPVHQYKTDVESLDLRDQLRDFSGADEGRRVRGIPRLDRLGDDVGTGAFS